jgi:hypothetical protein
MLMLCDVICSIDKFWEGSDWKHKKNHNKHIKIASLVGKIVSMSYVIGNVAYIMTKHLCIGILEKNFMEQLYCVDR